jgi:hypothetical protein
MWLVLRVVPKLAAKLRLQPHKTMYALVCRDSETLQPNAELCQALSMTAFMFDFLLKHRPEHPQATDHCNAMLEGALLKLAKLHCTVADVHPWSLDSAGTLIPCLQLCCKIAEHQTASGLSWQSIVARSLRFIDIVLRSPQYNFEEQAVNLRPQVHYSFHEKCTVLVIDLCSPLHRQQVGEH